MKVTFGVMNFKCNTFAINHKNVYQDIIFEIKVSFQPASPEHSLVNRCDQLNNSAYSSAPCGMERVLIHS